MANVQIKRYSGSAWVDINPKTTIGQVINLSSQLANMQSDIDGKATKLTIPQYTVPYRSTTGTGEPNTNISVSTGAVANTVAQRYTDGRLAVGTAVSGTDAINLTQGDGRYFKVAGGVPEAYLTWGGKNLIGQVTPIGMSLSNEHSANRLAFINGNSLYFEYSSNGGSTWVDYGYNATTKSQFCTTSASIPVGRNNGSAEYTVLSRTRVTLTAQNGTTGYVYTNPKKMLINVSSSGGMQVLVETRTGAGYQAGGAWTTFGTYSLSGWSGWNDIPLVLGTLGGGTTQTGNNWQLRLTFIMTSKDNDYPTIATVSSIRIYGENAWSTPSTMAATNNLYSFDMSQNALFPAEIYASNSQKVYHPGNKPTPEAIGAAKATHSHTIAQVTGLQTALDGKAPLPLASLRDFVQGTTINTSIDYSQSEGAPFLLRIYGNTYSRQIPTETVIQGYIYNNTIINYSGYSVGTPITGLVALNVGGKLTFWFPRQGYWEGYFAEVYDVGGAGGKVNLVTSILDTAKPVGTKEVIFSNTLNAVLDNDARLTNARPASDVSAWAKKSSLDLSDVPTISIAKGGTGATTALAARANLGLGNGATASNVIRQSNWDTTNKILTIEVV